MIYKLIFISTLLLSQLSVSWAELNDPTKPAVVLSNSTEPGQKELIVSAIWLSKKSSMALVNGTRVRPGQMLDGNVKILAIRRNTVIISDAGKVRNIYLVNKTYKLSKHSTQ